MSRRGCWITPASTADVYKRQQPVIEEQKAVEAIDVLEIREDAKKEDLF